MPNYEFQCGKCGHQFSQAMSVQDHDSKKVRCPKCGGEKVQHVIELVNVTTSKKS